MNKHLARLEELVDTAARHHDDLGRAMDKGDDLAADRAHVRLGRVLRDCQRCFRNIHEEAALQDLHNNQKTQNSGGMGEGTSGSEGGRSVALTWAARQAAMYALQGPIVLDGGAVGVHAIREAEFARRWLHSEAAARAGAYYRAPTRAERQEAVRRLARP